MKYIPFEQGVMNRIAYSVEDSSKAGEIIWAGSYSALKAHPKYRYLCKDWDEFSEEDYPNWVVVRDGCGLTAYNYNTDPCGVYCPIPASEIFNRNKSISSGLNSLK